MSRALFSWLPFPCIQCLVTGFSAHGSALCLQVRSPAGFGKEEMNGVARGVMVSMSAFVACHQC